MSKMKPVKSPRFSLLLLLMITLAAIPVAMTITPNNAMKLYFPKDSETIRFESELRQQFPLDQVFILIFQGENLFTDDFLSAMERLTEALEESPLVERVINITTQEHIEGTEDGFIVEPLLSAEDGRDPDQRKRWVLSDRFAPGMTVSTDGEVTTVIVRPVTEVVEDSRQVLALEKIIHEQIHRQGLTNRFHGLSGNLALDTAMYDSMIRDNLRFVPAGITIGVFLLWWMFRRFLPLLVMLAVVTTINAFALAGVALSGEPFTMPLSMVSSVATVMSIALLIHLYNALLYFSKRGLKGWERVKASITEIKKPVFYTVITTAIGFASLGFSPLPPLRIFGIVCAATLLMLYLITLYIVPAIFAEWDKGSWETQHSGINGVGLLIRRFSRFGIRHAGVTLTVIGMVLLLGMSQLPKLKVETDTFLQFPPDHPFVTSSVFLEENISGITPVEVIFDGPGRDALKAPERLGAIKTFMDKAKALDEVDYVVGMPHIIEEMNWAFHGEDPAFRVIPDQQRLISQYLFIYDGNDLFELVDREFQRTRVTLNLDLHGARAVRASLSRLEAILDSIDTDLKWTIAGHGKLFTEQERLLMSGQFYSAIGAFVLIFLCLLYIWRSVPAALLCMLPNLAPIVFVFIVMALLGIPINMATAVVSCMLLGIAVDDTIHLYQGYQSRVKKGHSAVVALARTYATSGKAITATTFILCAQFFFMIFSDFSPTSEFGLIVAVGLVAALLFDVLLLPALLILVSQQAEKRVELVTSQ